MRPILIASLILLSSTCLQDAWPNWLRIAGQPPAVVVGAVACLGLVRGGAEGCLAGLVGAVLLAGSGHVPLGGLAFSLMALGTGAGLLRGTLFAERMTVALLIAFGGVVLTSLLRMIFVPPQEFLVWTRDTFASAALGVPLTPLLFWLARLTRPPDRIA